jgi:ATP synthase F1 epsilon subunit
MLKFTLAVPEKPLLDSVAAEWVMAPAFEGYVQILPGHADYKALLATGLVRCRLEDGKEEIFVVEGGFLEVQNGHAVVLADAASPAGTLTPQHLEDLRKEAEAAMRAAALPAEVDKALQTGRRALAVDEALSRH